MRLSPALLPLLFLLGCDGSSPKDSAADDTAGEDTDDTGDTQAGDDTGETAPVDADGDGHSADEDCDDSEETVYPGAPEVCDGLDNDCDGTTDEDVTTTYHADADGDSYGDAGTTMEACDVAPSGYVLDGSDCDDADPDSYPGAAEVLDDGVDQDCDGSDLTSSVEGYLDDWDGTSYGTTSAGQCFLVQITLSGTLNVTHLGLAAEVRSASDLFDVVLYEDSSGSPGALIEGIEDTTLTTGENELALATTHTLSGDVWVGICNRETYANGIVAGSSVIALSEYDSSDPIPDPFPGSSSTFSVIPIMWVVGH